MAGVPFAVIHLKTMIIQANHLKMQRNCRIPEVSYAIKEAEYARIQVNPETVHLNFEVSEGNFKVIDVYFRMSGAIFRVYNFPFVIAATIKGSFNSIIESFIVIQTTARFLGSCKKASGKIEEAEYTKEQETTFLLAFINQNNFWFDDEIP
jgi:hypothetical protein